MTVLETERLLLPVPAVDLKAGALPKVSLLKI